MVSCSDGCVLVSVSCGRKKVVNGQDRSSAGRRHRYHQSDMMREEMKRRCGKEVQ